jgi:glycosyltransferase involved in cell wall biosynthesis
MHILCVNYHYDRELASAQDLLARYVTLREYAQALVGEGAEVTVLQRFSRDAELERAGVRYLFCADRCAPTLHRRWQIPLRFHRVARDVGATVAHVNGLGFSVPLWALRAALPASCALVAQHHAEGPSRRWPLVQRWCFRGVDGFLFTIREQAIPWVNRGVIARHQRIYEVLEGSTLFRRGDRAAARARTGLTGAPIVLWVGRLIALKDPLVVLRGFALALREAPDARLYMVYSDNTLLSDVRALVDADPSLRERVTLMGSRPHATLEDLYNSADYFVLGSHSEGSGYALLEALACGVVPVVTDIPSFRRITDGGRLGALWQPGDADACASAFLRAFEGSAAARSEEIAAVFQENLSFAAIARDAMRAYREVARERARS